MRNHDELTLDKLTDDERQEVFAAFGPDEDMQVYGRGLRRRLPPMLDGDPRRIRMVYSLLFSLPGTPVLFYGEEIGMGENLDVPGRMAVRTPMQWTAAEQRRLLDRGRRRSCRRRSSRAATARSSSTSRPSGATPTRCCRSSRCSSAATASAPSSAGARSPCSSSRTRQVLAHTVTWDDACLVALHNLAAEPVAVPLALPGPRRRHAPGRPARDGSTALDEKGRVEVSLDGVRLPLAARRAPGDRRLRD